MPLCFWLGKQLIMWNNIERCTETDVNHSGVTFILNITSYIIETCEERPCMNPCCPSQKMMGVDLHDNRGATTAEKLRA